MHIHLLLIINLLQIYNVAPYSKQTLINNGCFDEYRYQIVPVVQITIFHQVDHLSSYLTILFFNVLKKFWLFFEST